MNPLYKASAACGAMSAFLVLFVLAIAEKSVPVVDAFLATGVPVVYYGQVMVLLIGSAIGILVALVVLFLGSGEKFHRSQRRDYSKRFFGYGGVGFLTLGLPALLMDPAAMSVGMGVVLLWKILSVQNSELRAMAATPVEQEKENVKELIGE